MSIWRLFTRDRREQDLDEEIQAHLAMAIRARIERGEDPRAAELAARREFGNRTLIQETTRDMWGRRLPGELLQDARYALRGMRRSPSFTVVAVLTLALGIGANTAIFSVIDAILLRPLAFPHPDRLVALWNGPGLPLSGPSFLDWQRENQAFTSMALYIIPQSYNLTGGGQPSYVAGVATEADFFSTLGVTPLLGRTWAKGEDKAGADREVVLSYGLWQSQFAANRHIIGRQVELNDRAYTVVGVMPRGFNFPLSVELWVPMDMSPNELGGRGDHGYLAIGRMKPGVTLHQAQADLSLIVERVDKLYPNTNTNAHVGAWVNSLHDWLFGPLEMGLWLMLSAVALVLLIACVNIANLLLARSSARHKEMAVRGALGASRWRLLRQSLSESILLALLGGGTGLLFGWAGIQALPLLTGPVPAGVPPIGLNGSVLAFTLLLALASGLLFGLAPAWESSRAAVLAELRGGAGAVVSTGRRRRLIGNGLVAAEIAISLTLLVAAGLMLKSFVKLRSTDFGVRRDGILTAQVNLPRSKYGSDAKILTFTRALLQRVGGLPGVLSAAMTDHLPLYGHTNGTITLYGKPTHTDNSLEQSVVEMHGITPGYFKTMDIPLIAGRRLTEEDHDRALALSMELSSHPTTSETRNVIYPVDINRTMARKYWPRENPIGQRFSFHGDSGPWMEVVGVVGDTRQWGLRVPPRPEEYQPFFGSTYGGTILVLHTALPALSLAPAVKQQVAALDPDLPVFHVRTMNQLVAQQSAGDRIASLLIGLFAGLAVLLAAVGIYGVMAYVVAQRTNEIGIHMALGAQKSDVLRMVAGQGLKLALIGVAIGVAAALALTRFLSSLLYGVKPTDPLTFIAVSLILIAVALLACYVPARRAAKVDPMEALRQE
jgi:putative ABC transport system permease protein